jgi:hypothetical protein
VELSHLFQRTEVVGPAKGCAELWQPFPLAGEDQEPQAHAMDIAQVTNQLQDLLPYATVTILTFVEGIDDPTSC